jgi:hypothetical protein
MKFLLLDLPGKLFISRAIFHGSYREMASPLFPDRQLLLFTSPWMFLWNNYEDGIDGLRGGAPEQFWWRDETALMSEEERIYQWSAKRNKTDNLQFSWFCPPPDPSRVRFVKLENGGQVVWQGWRHYVWSPLPKWFPLWEAISFGFDRHPEDVNPLPEGDVRRFGCGFGGKLTVRS